MSETDKSFKTLAKIRAEVNKIRLSAGGGLGDAIVADIYANAEQIAAKVLTQKPGKSGVWSERVDDILTSRIFGYPVMLALLGAVFWLTIEGANYPSQLLAAGLLAFQDRLTLWFELAGAPQWLHGMLVLGMYRASAWVVAVMLPPMAIFFPLFTLLEDLGYLPRVAFNLDSLFKKCKSCGKQALTMCMVTLKL